MKFGSLLIFVIAGASCGLASADSYTCKRPDGSTYVTDARPLDVWCRFSTESDEPFTKKVEIKPPKPKKAFRSNPKKARQIEATGRLLVLDGLKDPDSARFRRVFVKDDIALCGEINAKNSYGGYTGYTRFVSLGTKGTTWIDSDAIASEFNKVYMSVCLGQVEPEYRWETEPTSP